MQTDLQTKQTLTNKTDTHAHTKRVAEIKIQNEKKAKPHFFLMQLNSVSIR